MSSRLERGGMISNIAMSARPEHTILNIDSGTTMYYLDMLDWNIPEFPLDFESLYFESLH